ncbi:MAG: hypothetical protein AB1568_17150, partial [Thermodesulfobacteriota bacterium]
KRSDEAIQSELPVCLRWYRLPASRSAAALLLDRRASLAMTAWAVFPLVFARSAATKQSSQSCRSASGGIGCRHPVLPPPCFWIAALRSR